jgi:hypothetical protein
MPRKLAVAAELRSAAPANSEVLTTLAAGDVFEVLEFAGQHAWGVAPGAGLVGYIPATALATVE